MKKIWVTRYNDGSADVWDEEKGPPSWPYIDAFDVENNLKNLQSELDALRTELSALKKAARDALMSWSCDCKHDRSEMFKKLAALVVEE